MAKFLYNTEKVLKTLTVMEQHVIRMHYGLDDGDPKNLTEISYEYDLTRERIRQIKECALRKLRDPQIIRELVYDETVVPETSETTAHNNNNTTIV